ncbi:hypothetical protein [Clostridium botulinum]|uniref:hypothetical protein n=1 Tax=Clostridium botulinum TaxID=1491 RepID=UPI001C9A8140|nr:hypothetical protein [Clostridium botulinum]MBY6838787.1 hypothetical protein [Clostridium botulinum]
MKILDVNSLQVSNRIRTVNKKEYEVLNKNKNGKFTLKAIDSESIEQAKVDIEKFIKNNKFLNDLANYTLESILTIDNIEPQWFIERKAVLI